MKGSVNIVYLLILVIGTFGLISLLRYAQKEVLAELEDVLIHQNNPIQYLQMLKSKRLGLILRKGSLALLEFYGYLCMGEDSAIEDIIKKVDSAKLNRGEKLVYLQRKFSYYIQAKQYEKARETYSELEHLLEGEKNENCKALLEQASSILKMP